MAVNRFPHLQSLVLLVEHLAAWWQSTRLAWKLAAVASVLVVGGMAHLGVIVTGHIKDNVIHKSAAAAALYMDSFVERHAQELATNSALSDESRKALERLLSPASMHRPIIAFRIWKGDTVAFSNEHELIGKTFPRTASRERAWQGQMAVEFDQADSDDDEQVRSLQLPVLEVYAPVRERGTGRIVGLVETYEIAVQLKNEVWVNQFAAWVAIAAIALTVVLLLFSMASMGRIERNSLLARIGELLRLGADSERRRQRTRQATLHVTAMNENSLRRVGHELHDGPAQHVALALLKFESLKELVSKANVETPLHADERQKDLEVILVALNEALRHIRGVASTFLPTDIEDLSVTEMFARVARHHERQTGVPVKFENHGLPEQLPFSLKTCLYRFALEGLDSLCTTSSVQLRSICVSCDGEKMVLEIAGADETVDARQWLAAGSPRFRSLRARIEAVGGKFRMGSTRSGQVSLIAELCSSEMELAGG